MCACAGLHAGICECGIGWTEDKRSARTDYALSAAAIARLEPVQERASVKLKSSHMYDQRFCTVERCGPTHA